MNRDPYGYPHARAAVVRFLDRRIEELRGVRTQREIAADAGFNKPNVVSMLRSGQTQLAFNKIPGMARALDVDAAHLFRLAMQDRWPELETTIAEIFGDRQLATRHEAEILLRPWRLATDDQDPLPDAHIRAEVERLIKSLFTLR